MDHTQGLAREELEPHACAAKEAYEEAGIVGKIGKRPLGTYRYKKRLRSGARATFEVETYLLEVERQLSDWPEKGQRVTRWMTPSRAARLVGEDGLVRLLLSLNAPPPLRRWRFGAWPRRRSARAPGAFRAIAARLRALMRLARLWRRTKPRP